jgi:hypothetical protein
MLYCSWDCFLASVTFSTEEINPDRYLCFTEDSDAHFPIVMVTDHQKRNKTEDKRKVDVPPHPDNGRVDGFRRDKFANRENK